jgi:hypothetical protein
MVRRSAADTQLAESDDAFGNGVVTADQTGGPIGRR